MSLYGNFLGFMEVEFPLKVLLCGDAHLFKLLKKAREGFLSEEPPSAVTHKSQVTSWPEWLLNPSSYISEQLL